MKVIAVFIFASFVMLAQDTIELRSTSNASYRYADWSHSFANKWATDIYYIGVPDNNEASACGGYSLPTLKGLSLNPFLCGAIAKENKEMGIKAAVAVAWEHNTWKADAYFAHLWTLRGTISSYDLLDAGNLTKMVGKKLEVGISTGYFLQDKNWNPLVGPLVRYDDRVGAWAISYRFGPANELRFARTLNLRRSHP